MKIQVSLILAVIVQFAYGQEVSVVVSLSDCIQQALKNNPAVQVSQAKVDAAVARADEASTALLPQLKFSGRAAELSNVPEYTLTLPLTPVPISKTLFPSITENYSARLTLQQPLFMGFKLQKNEEMASLNAQASREDYVKDKSDLILGVTTAYWSLYEAVRAEKVLNQTVSQMAEHVKDIQSFAKQGMATDAEVMKVQVQLSDMKVRQIEARNAIHVSSMNMNMLIGNDVDVPIRTTDSVESDPLEEPTLASDLSTYTAMAKEQRPELRALQLRKEVNQAGVVAAKAGWYPQVFLAANYDYSRPNQRIIPPKDEWDATWDVGVTLQWNIWDWMATKHQTAQAEANLRQTEAGVKQMQDAITLDVAQQYYNAQTAKEKVGVALGGKEQAQESYRITSEKFKHGVSSSSELLDAEVALMQSNLTYTRALVDYKLSIARLKKAVGQ